MDVFVEFCKSNILFLVIVGLFLVLMILLLIFAPKRFNQYLLALVVKIPAFIIDCERKGILGAENKLKYVVDLSVNYLAAISGVKLEKIIDKYFDLINSYIEEVLTTPQRKDVNYAKK